MTRIRWTQPRNTARRLFEDARADLRMLLRTLTGDGPSPVLRSSRRAPAPYVSVPAPWQAPSAPAASHKTATGAHVRIVAGGVNAALLASAEAATMTVTLAGARHTVAVKRGQSVLAAAERAGLVMPFSCRAGGCGACRVRLVAGSLALPETHCLSLAELEAGEVLTCCSSPVGDISIEVKL